MSTNSSVSWLGNRANIVDDGNVYTFTVGNNPTMSLQNNDPEFVRNTESIFFTRWLNINGYHVLSRGTNNLKAEEIEFNIKKNRLHPRLIDKQSKFLYGKGLHGYYQTFGEDGKLERGWAREQKVFDWLESWERNGLEAGYQEFAQNLIRHFYTHYEFFPNMRMAGGKQYGYAKYPIVGAELLENTNCRLATDKNFDIVRTIPKYSDFKYIAFGNWGLTTNNFEVFHRFKVSDIHIYDSNAVAHYRQNSVGEFYGSNETYEGTKTWIKNSNDSPEYIRSFIDNSLSAKVHIIIPNAYLEARRKELKALCEENQKRKSQGLDLITFNNIEIGTEYFESTFKKILTEIMKEAVNFQTGKKNQGKTFFSWSFRNGTEEERWRFEPLDLKYKEYTDALISIDKRADEVLVSSMGLSPQITGVVQPGQLSSSGSDAYTQIILYMLLLSQDDEICSRPFNDMLRINMPDLYKKGYRLGYYREMPSRQSEITPDNRLQNQTA